MKTPITIENTKNCFHISISENGLKLSTIFKAEIGFLLEEGKLCKLFIELAQQVWMNPETLVALKDLIIIEHPGSNEDWEGISKLTQRIFKNENEEIQTTHTNNIHAFNSGFCLN